MCTTCENSSTLNDKACREQIFSALLREPLAERIVLSHLYERDYESKEMEILYELAHLQETLGNYIDMDLSFNCQKEASGKYCSDRNKKFNYVIETSKNDPFRSIQLLRELQEENKGKKGSYGLNIADVVHENDECDRCTKRFQSVVNEIWEAEKGLRRLFDHDENSTLDIDYDQLIKPNVRPAFSTSRIYVEPPELSEFLECYDIPHNNGRDLQVSIYEMTDRPEKLYMIIPREYNLDANTLKMVERVRKKLIRFRPDDMNFANPANSREYFRRIGKKMLEEDARSHKITLIPADVNTYSELLAKYTTGLGILEDILSDTRVTDVYINAPADKNPVHVVIDGDECVTNIFLSQDDLDSMVSRFRAISGRPFGEATPILEMELKEFGVRVSVIGDPLSANGLAYAFRKHSRKPWTLPKLIAMGSISPLTAGLLSFLMDGETSILVAGEVGAGKTSLLSAMIMEIPQKYRILTIEDTRELPIEDLQEMGWKMQGMSSRSSILNTNLEIRPDVALRAALRLGNSSLVIGEVRGEEVKVLYEAMQVGAAGNSVLGTIHGASASAVYERIVHTLGVPAASFKATDAVVVCTNTRVGGSMSKKRRVTQICEVVSGWDETADPNDIFADIMEYNAATDSLIPTDILDRGQSELVGKIAHKWGISIDTASLNIRIRGKIKEKMAIAGQTNPDIMEAEAVSKANNMFWLYMDMEKNDPEGPDYENVYQKWSDWFDRYSSAHI